MDVGVAEGMKLLWVELGNRDAIEAYRDPLSDDPELVRFKPQEGEQITRIEWQLPEGVDPPTRTDRVRDVKGHISLHLAPGAKPAWVDSEDDDFSALLAEELGVKDYERPDVWGQEDA